MAGNVPVDAAALREQVQEKYRQVALDPGAGFHFHTGRPLAHRLGYDPAVVDATPDQAVASFAGVANPFALRRLCPGERAVDVGAGAGFDAFIAATQVGVGGRVVGVDMTPEMLQRSRATARLLGLEQVEFRRGLAEALPVADQWADTVLANGVFNLCADKRAVFGEIWRVLKPGGWLQFADRQRPPRARGGAAGHRSVDRVNRRWAAPCGLAISLTTGLEDTERVTVAFLVAVGAAEQGRPTLMFLTKEAVRLVVPGVATGVACEGCPPLPDLLRRFADAGGRYYVCPICFDARKLDKGDLLANAELNGTVPLWQWIGDEGATTFSY
jgi:arsenite methyltransferase